ncbi:hypothetical protein BDP81DRAFT_454278 [Colletotrichum phormii]|uniref:AAA+ ATPase lid domain-containing protein n=1 Tax=Colletotrichum phormii TaxID=359342 RepID=A0AAI9ZFZ6_9PEZI|nr:uncharacterized protein BDP81DRAFT_454278 [Colletotrichum phormii]KAK1623840.1 hypothetical protein BDP81DRAFT_454278 [Colletotrichum phormii]
MITIFSRITDEAGIFLAKRVRGNIRHNVVTSVFLRTLEYHVRILFLTSNRVGVIDPAFKPRIQNSRCLSHRYNDLDLLVTFRIHQTFIKRAKEERKDTGTQNFKIKEKQKLNFAEKHYNRLGLENRHKWNGWKVFVSHFGQISAGIFRYLNSIRLLSMRYRQIRNAFRTAIALVEYRYVSKEADDPKSRFGKKQFEKVVKGFKEFNSYLININGAMEADEARRGQTRWSASRSSKDRFLAHAIQIN